MNENQLYEWNKAMSYKYYWIRVLHVPISVLPHLKGAAKKAFGSVLSSSVAFADPVAPDLWTICFDMALAARLKYKRHLVVDMGDYGFVELEVACTDSPWCCKCRRFFHSDSDPSCPRNANYKEALTKVTKEKEVKEKPKEKEGGEKVIEKESEKEEGEKETEDKEGKGKGLEEKERTDGQEKVTDDREMGKAVKGKDKGVGEKEGGKNHPHPNPPMGRGKKKKTPSLPKAGSESRRYKLNWRKKKVLTQPPEKSTKETSGLDKGVETAGVSRAKLEKVEEGGKKEENEDVRMTVREDGGSREGLGKGEDKDLEEGSHLRIGDHRSQGNDPLERGESVVPDSQVLTPGLDGGQGGMPLTENPSAELETKSVSPAGLGIGLLSKEKVEEEGKQEENENVQMTEREEEGSREEIGKGAAKDLDKEEGAHLRNEDHQSQGKDLMEKGERLIPDSQVITPDLNGGNPDQGAMLLIENPFADLQIKSVPPSGLGKGPLTMEKSNRGMTLNLVFNALEEANT
ncbi:hypothetical protein CBR_g46279 [Chara braunii]|uniref:Uncharacterized protein n=1 Tax=Chara braunii TaxID=69332 RepID=A0A388K458_CHABU|nr:hypothetical protein CBR_g46279 [Chara braunii]|eukprot:GBG64733.1 hypothetical protein CBR_g46279 [Chara braunii]